MTRASSARAARRLTPVPASKLRYYKDARGVEFIETVWEGRNESGLKVHGRNVLVLMDQASNPTSTGVHLPDEKAWANTQRSQSGVITHIGPEAFRLYADGSKWDGDKPTIGERIMIEEYAGVILPGMDGRVYRSMDYANIACAYNEEGLAAMDEEAA